MSQLEKYKIKYYKCKQQKQEMLQVGGAGIVKQICSRNILKYNNKLIVAHNCDDNKITGYSQFNPDDQTWTQVTTNIEFNNKDLSIATDDEIKPLMDEVRKFKIYMPGDIIVDNTNNICIIYNMIHLKNILKNVTDGNKITEINVNSVNTQNVNIMKVNHISNNIENNTQLDIKYITRTLYQNNKQFDNSVNSIIPFYGALFDLTQRTKLTPGVTPLYNILTNQLVVYQDTNIKTGTEHFDTYTVKDINGKDETYSGVTLVPFDIQKQMNYHTEKADLQETLLSVPNTGLSANMFLPM